MEKNQMCVGGETEVLGCAWNVISVPGVFVLKCHPEVFADGKHNSAVTFKGTLRKLPGLDWVLWVETINKFLWLRKKKRQKRYQANIHAFILHMVFCSTPRVFQWGHLQGDSLTLPLRNCKAACLWLFITVLRAISVVQGLLQGYEREITMT